MLNNLTTFDNQTIHETQSEKSNELSIYKRLLLALSILLTLFIHNFIEYSVLDMNNKENLETTCNSDLFFRLTESFSKYVQSNPTLRKAFTITSSLIIDISVISFATCWVVYSRTWRPLLNIGLFYAFRGLCNAIFYMKKPHDLVWGFPGFPSATVSYHEATDFFFSGHVGINLITAIELRRFKFYKLSYLSFFGIFFQISLLLAVRGHYTIDLLAGLISAHYLNIISYKLTKYVDYLINVDYKVQNLLLQPSIIKDLHNEFNEFEEDKHKLD